MGVETGSGTLVGLLASLSAIDGEVFIRAAVRTGSQSVWHVDAVVAPPSEPPGWQPQVWEYNEVTFIAGQSSSRALAAALDPGDAQVLSLGGYDLTFPVLHEQVPWQHKPSRACRVPELGDWSWPGLLCESEALKVGAPASDRDAHGKRVHSIASAAARLAGLADPDAHAEQVQATFLPDVVTYQPGQPASFQPDSGNGRALDDNAFDIAVAVGRPLGGYGGLRDPDGRRRGQLCRRRLAVKHGRGELLRRRIGFGLCPDHRAVRADQSR